MDIGKYGVLKGIETAVRRRHKNVELFFRRLRKEVLFVEIDFGDEAFCLRIRIDGGKPRADQDDSRVRPVLVDEIKQFLSFRRIRGLSGKTGFFLLLFRIF